MKNIMLIISVTALIFFSCSTRGADSPPGPGRSSLTDDEGWFCLHGGELIRQDGGFLFRAPGRNAMALHRVGPYFHQVKVEFAMKTAAADGPMNGFLLLADNDKSDRPVLSGALMGAGELSIEGRGVLEPVTTPLGTDALMESRCTVLLNLDERWIEFSAGDSRIRTSLIGDLDKIDMIGFHGRDTATWFGRLRISGD